MPLTPKQLAQIDERTRRECEEQGLPFTIEDPATLGKIARLAAGAWMDRPDHGRA